MDPITQAKQHLTSGELSKFIPRIQKRVIADLLRGEERGEYARILNELADRIAKMPVSYQTDGQHGEAIVYLHYFTGGCDWWITEKDKDGGTPQAFGKADIGQGDSSYGYMSIDEFTAHPRVELDLLWVPKPIKECGKD